MEEKKVVCINYTKDTDTAQDPLYHRPYLVESTNEAIVRFNKTHARCDRIESIDEVTRLDVADYIGRFVCEYDAYGRDIEPEDIEMLKYACMFLGTHLNVIDE